MSKREFSEAFMAEKYKDVDIWPSHKRVMAIITTALDLAYVEMRNTEVKGDLGKATQELLNTKPVHVLNPLAVVDSQRVQELKEIEELTKLSAVPGMPQGLIEKLRSMADPLSAFIEGAHMGLLAAFKLRDVGDPLELVGQCVDSTGKDFERFMEEAREVLEGQEQKDREKRPFSAASAATWKKSDLSEDAPASSPWPRQEEETQPETVAAVMGLDDNDDFPC